MFEFSLSWDFIVRFLSITLIDFALSGDNVIVIAMAAASLPRKRRKWVILAGSGLAIFLRVALTAIVTYLMRIPLISAAGGLVLFWIAWKLMRLDVHGKKTTKLEAEQHEKKTFRQAVFLIVTADFMMSLDNVIAIAGSAHGNPLLVILGLLISMPLLIGTGGAVSLLIDKFKWLIYLGAGVIIFTATRMILEDRIVAGWIKLDYLAVLGIAVAVGAVLTWIFGLLTPRPDGRKKRGGWRRPRKP